MPTPCSEASRFRGPVMACDCFVWLCPRKRLMLFSLKFQRNNRQNALAMDSAQGENLRKSLHFHRVAEMKQPYALTEPFVLWRPCAEEAALCFGGAGFPLLGKGGEPHVFLNSLQRPRRRKSGSFPPRWGALRVKSDLAGALSQRGQSAKPPFWPAAARGRREGWDSDPPA